MQGDERITVHRRRTRAEVGQLGAEFVDSGMRRSEFCQSRGLSWSTLDRHLKKRRWKRKTRSAPAEGKLVAVELAIRKPPAEQPASCGLAVGLWGERPSEVQGDFDLHTLGRLGAVFV